MHLKYSHIMNVFITGASSGLGRATAAAFARNGTKLILAARRYERLESLTAEVGVPCHLIRLDVRDRAAVHAAVEAIPHAFRPIDVLVNNAGLSRGLAPLHEGSEDDWDEMIDTNVKGLLYVTRAVLPEMVQRGRGHVINIGSVAGHETYPRGNVYCASKAAVAVINKGLRLDLSGTGVRVSSIDPGLVPTEFSEVRFHGNRELAAKVYEGTRPLSAADVADAVVWCAGRPPWVNVEDILLMPTDQASPLLTYRRPLDPSEETPADSLAARWLAAWNERRLDDIMALYAPDATHTSDRVKLLGGESATVHGSAAIRDYFRRGLERYPDLHFEPISISEGLRTVVVEYTSHRVGERQNVVEVLQVDDSGAIACSRVYHCG